MSKKKKKSNEKENVLKVPEHQIMKIMIDMSERLCARYECHFHWDQVAKIMF